MGAPPDLPLREQAEPTLNQVQPGRMGRREVQVMPRSAGKPSANGRSLVGRIVVQHDVHLCRRGKLGIQMIEKFLEFARAMTSKTLSDYIAGGYVQSCEQGRSPMPLVIVTPALGLSRSHRQDGLGAIQRLNLAFFVHTQYQRVIRWVHVKPYDVAHFLHQPGIAGELKGLAAMGQQSEGPPNAADRGLA